MIKNLFNKRVPTVFALIVLVIIIGVSTVLIKSGIFYVGNAAPDTQPENLRITNITDSSFTIVFTTKGYVPAAVHIQEVQSGSLVLDDRDKKTGEQNKYYSHHISVQTLKPETQTQFSLIVGGKEYSDKSYSVTTGPVIPDSPPAQNPIFGKILLPNSDAGSDTLVIIKTDTSQFISSVTDNKGEFILPTNSLRDTSNSNYIVLRNNTKLTVEAYRQLMSAKATTIFGIAQNLPAITLLEQYVFTETESKSSTSSSQLDVSSPLSSSDFTVQTPFEGESFIDLKPQFNGTAPPNSSLSLEIVGIEKKQIISKGDGSWTYRPAKNIAQGERVFKVSLNGTQPKSITRNFSIFPLGSQVTESATPSATPTLRPTTVPTSTPKVTPTKQPTPSPTIKISATPTTALLTPTLSPTTQPTPTLLPSPTAIIPTNTPTPTPSPTIVVVIPTKTTQIPTKLPPIAKPGATENTLVLTGLSVILILAGTVMMFLL